MTAPVGTDDPRAPRVLTFVFLTVFLDMIGFGIVLPLFPYYVTSMGGSARTVGFLLSCFSLTQLVASPILGRLSDRVGRRKVILLSLAGNAVAMLLFAFATRTLLLPLLFASRILAGLTAGNLSACQAAIADVTSGAARAKGMGRVGAGLGLGLVLGPVLASVVSRVGPWAPPLAAGALAFVDLVAAFFFMPETRPSPGERRALVAASEASEKAPAKIPLWRALTERSLLLVLGLYFFTFLYMTTLQVALALVAKERFGWGSREIGIVFGCHGALLLVVQGLLIGRIARLLGARRVVIVGALLSGAGLVTIGLAFRIPVMAVGLAALGLGLGVTQPVLSTIASDLAGRDRQGAVLGFAQSSGGLARTIGPTLSGFLYEAIDSSAPFLGGAIAASVVFLLSLTLPRDTAT